MSATIENYLTSQSNRWAQSTLKSERARLNASSDVLHMSPNEAYEHLKIRLAPYALKTTLIRLSDYKSWCGDTTWKHWMKQNSNTFKNSYKKEVLHGKDFEKVNTMVADIVHPCYRELAKEILHSGLRASEALHRRGDHVDGKGAKIRRVFAGQRISDGDRGRLTYQGLYRALRAVGLKPHTLRKVFATRLARSGRVGEADLMRVMGWSTMQTASAYLQPQRDEQLQKLVQEVIA